MDRKKSNREVKSVSEDPLLSKVLIMLSNLIKSLYDQAKINSLMVSFSDEQSQVMCKSNQSRRERPPIKRSCIFNESLWTVLY